MQTKDKFLTLFDLSTKNAQLQKIIAKYILIIRNLKLHGWCKLYVYLDKRWCTMYKAPNMCVYVNVCMHVCFRKGTYIQFRRMP